MDFKKILKYLLNINSFAVLFSLGAMIALLVSNAVQGYSLGAIAVLSAIFAFVFLAGGAVTACLFDYKHPLSVGLKLLGLAASCVSILQILSLRIILISALFTWDPHNALGWSAFYSSVVALVFGLITVVTVIVSGFLKGGDKKKQVEAN